MADERVSLGGDAAQPEAKQEWERILEEALNGVDSGTRQPASGSQSDPELWDLDAFLNPGEPAAPASQPPEESEIPAPVHRQRREPSAAQTGRTPQPRQHHTGQEREVRRSGNESTRHPSAHEPQKKKGQPSSNPRLKKIRRNRFWLLAYLWLTLVFTEILVRAATNQEMFWRPGLFLSLLFAIAPAMLCFALVTSFKKTKVNKGILIGIQAVVYLLYASQLVYYKAFDQFYTAVSMGNAKQGFGFMGTILQIIGQNIIALIVLALPLIFVCVFGKHFFSFKGGKSWLGSVLLAVVGIVLHFLVVLILPLWGTDTRTPYDMYHYVYDVKDSAAQLGLGTAFRLDAKWAVFGTGKTHGLDLSVPNYQEKPGDTDASGGETTPDGTGASEPGQTTPVEYGDNILEDLDLEALAAAEGDSDIRDMHLYFNSIQPTRKNEKTGMFEGCNLILITAESFSHLAIDPEVTPTLYKMQTQGFNFTNFYTPIWGVSTSDGEYVAVTGTIPKAGVWSFYRTGEQKNYMPLIMCAQLKNLGYCAYGYHNHDYGYYDRDLSHPNLGYIYKGMGNGMEEGVKKQWPESDLEMIDFTTPDYINQEPFHAYYMTVSGHKEYNFLGGNKMSSKNQDAVSDLPYSETVQAYLATQIELDKAMELLLQRLEEAGVAENTVIVISADHYPYGLTPEQIGELEGHEIDTTFEMYRNALIIYRPGMTPETIDEACCSMDILPTLSNLFGIEYDSRLYMGHDIFSDAEPLVIFQERSWITDKAIYNAKTGEVESLTGEEIDDDYVSYIKSVVNNKFSASANILDMDYWRILFGKDE